LNYSSWCWFDEDPHPVDIRYTHSNLIMCPSNHCKIQEIFKFQWIAGAFIFYLVLNIRWWLWVTVPKWNWTFVLLSYHKCIMRNKKITQPFHELLHESEMEGIHSTQVIIDALRLPLIDISFKTNAKIATLKHTFKLSLLLTGNNDLILHFSNHRQQKLRFLRLIVLQLMSIINDCYSKLCIL